MKVTIYVLLGMVKDGKIEYEQKIKIGNEIIAVSHLLGAYIFTKERLNDEVEILEEEKKIPEKLDVELLGQCDNWTQKYNKDTKEMENPHIELNPYVIDTIRENTLEIQHKINEIIDYLKSKGDK